MKKAALASGLDENTLTLATFHVVITYDDAAATKHQHRADQVRPFMSEFAYRDSPIVG